MTAWNRKYAGVRWIAMLCAMVLLLSGCSTSDQTNRQIQLAITGDQEVYAYDDSIFHAIDMAVEDCNDLYAAQGYHVSYQTSDDGSVYDKGVTQASDFAKNANITAILGTHNFTILDMAAEIAQQQNKLLVTFNGCNDSVTQKGYSMVVDNVFGAAQSGATMADYVNQTPEIQHIAIYNSSVSYEQDWIQAFIRGLGDGGAQVVDCAGTATSANDFAVMAERWRTLQVDTVLILEYYAADAFYAAETLHQIFPNIRLLGDSSFDYDAMLQESGEVAEGLVIPDVLMYGEGNAIAAFNQRYADKYGKAPSRWAVHAYDTVRMIADTAVAIGSTDSVKIAEALHREEGYQGVCGLVTFDENGQLVGSQQRLLVCKNGKFVALT